MSHAAKDQYCDHLEDSGLVIQWTDNLKYGPPDEPGMYLVAFNDGTVESFNLWEDEVNNPNVEWWTIPTRINKLIITHWAELPAHPEASDE